MTEWVRTLELTTVASCSVRCAYGPQGVLRAAYRGAGVLDFDSFQRVVDKLPQDVRIHFSGFVEPWLNPKCTSMLLHALDAGRRVAVYTTTIGMRDPLIVTEALRRYAHLVDHACVHLPDVHGHMQRLPEAGAIEAFRQVPGVEWMSMGGSAIPTEQLSVWAPIDRAGSLTGKSLPIVRHVGPIRCSYTPTYDHNVMLPNGDVVLCCMDYGLKHKLGNLFEQSWDELDRTQVAKDNEGSDGTTICRRCNGSEKA